MAVGAGDAAFSSDAERGDFERDPFALPAFRKGEPVRLTTGGVPVRDGGLLGRLIEGLSHEEKKSSSSPAGVAELSDGVPEGISVMTTSSGYLRYDDVNIRKLTTEGVTDCCASAAARLLSSSLYLTAALDVYLTLTSLLASAADPPCDWKYLVADSFPPTFITRSCSHCHSAKIASASVL